MNRARYTIHKAGRSRYVLLREFPDRAVPLKLNTYRSLEKAMTAARLLAGRTAEILVAA